MTTSAKTQQTIKTAAVSAYLDFARAYEDNRMPELVSDLRVIALDLIEAYGDVVGEDLYEATTVVVLAAVEVFPVAEEHLWSLTLERIGQPV